MADDMADESTQLLQDRLVKLERDLDHLARGVGLLGIKPCCWCGKFFRSIEPATLFDHGAPVCFRCIPDWWHRQSGLLGVKEREIAEHAMKMWLIGYHHADVIKRQEDVPKNPQLELVVGCYECHASGYLHDVRCRFCDGRGTVWVVVKANS